MYLQSVSMMPKGIFYADLRLANYLYFEVPLIRSVRFKPQQARQPCEFLGGLAWRTRGKDPAAAPSDPRDPHLASNDRVMRSDNPETGHRIHASR